MARVFVAGGTGVLGRRVVPLLVAAGHEVTGTTRRPDRADALRAAGAVPVVVDALDAVALRDAVVAARPEVVAHLLTDLTNPRGGDLDAAQLDRNARLRETGTRHLIDAAVAARARRFVAQSIGWLCAPGREPHPETDPLLPPDTLSRRAVHELERLVTTTPGLDGLVLRFGRFWGPDTWDAEPPDPPTVHVDAAAIGIARAVDRGRPGIYHLADDGPLDTTKARRELGWTSDLRST